MTGVQTCALPICSKCLPMSFLVPADFNPTEMVEIELNWVEVLVLFVMIRNRKGVIPFGACIGAKTPPCSFEILFWDDLISPRFDSVGYKVPRVFGRPD